jgi:predicted metal-dependent hydrolase
MAFRQIELPVIGTIKLYKRRGSRSIRLSIAHDGSVRVTLPMYVPYQAGLSFVHQKQTWISMEQSRTKHLLKSGDKIGKAHHLRLVPSPAQTRISTRLQGSIVQVIYPAQLTAVSAGVQKAARQASLRALKLEATALLPRRLALLAAQGQFTYRKLGFKQLKSRWGSCNERQEITLNIYLMQLPWEFIDYVLYHELTHTKILHHGPAFWQELERHVPRAKQFRKLIRSYQPVIQA